jgi:hypothetical protein
MKWKLGDHGVIWREKYLADSLNHLLGKEVIIVDIRSSNADWYDMGWLDGNTLVLRGGSSSRYVSVRRYNSKDEALYRIDARCMSKTTKKIEAGSWDECPFVPEDLK